MSLTDLLHFLAIAGAYTAMVLFVLGCMVEIIFLKRVGVVCVLACTSLQLVLAASAQNWTSAIWYLGSIAVLIATPPAAVLVYRPIERLVYWRVSSRYGEFRREMPPKLQHGYSLFWS